MELRSPDRAAQSGGLRTRVAWWFLLLTLPVYFALLLWATPTAASVLEIVIFCVLVFWTMPMRSMTALPFVAPGWWSGRDRAIVLLLLRLTPGMLAIFAVIEIVRVSAWLIALP